jgi:hypothetical protein
MAIKELRTRVLLRYDSHDNWLTADPVLGPGEIACVTVTDELAGEVTLIKVGNDEDKYSDLPFLYAKAADVIQAAKSDEALKTFINNLITAAALAPKKDLDDLVTRVTAAESAITTAKDEAISQDVVVLAEAQSYTDVEVAKLQTQINTIMNNPDTEGVINSINEFTQYIEDHGELAEGFRTSINDIYKLINNIDYSALAFDTTEIIVGSSNTTSVLGQAILGQLVLA